MHDEREREIELHEDREEGMCSEASLTLEIFGDTRTTNTRHR